MPASRLIKIKIHMSNSTLSSRMATGLALLLATAAITACGGGGGTSESEAATAGTAPSASTESTSASDSSTVASVDAATVTTNVNAVTATSGDTATTATADNPTVASVDTSAVAPTNVSVESAPAVAPAAVTTASVAPATVTVASVAPATVTTASVAPASIAPTEVNPATTTTGAMTPVLTQTMSRPAGNTGTGFFVVGSKLYDAKGAEFRIRGVNRTHWDNGSNGLALSNANTERIAMDFTKTTSVNLGIINTQMVSNKIIPMPGNWKGTCKADPAVLATIVDSWVAQAPAWTQLNSNGLINIANEWGPSNSTIWRDAYITAIARMRAAGYTGTLIVDSGGCGQDAQDVVKYGAAVLASDPQKNILFDVHVYGGFHYPATATWMQDYSKAMAQLKVSGLPIMLGEFGPGRNIGPSPTMVTPQQIITTAEESGFGWLAWAWDDNDLANCAADDNWFSMTKKCGTYKTDDDLTSFGKAVVPILKSTAVRATTFN
jgi:mannan endo-1,4-beta-mannosidase